MNPLEILSLKNALNRLLNCGPVNAQVGICGNLIQILGNDFRESELYPYFKTWLDFSGSCTYPICGYENAQSDGTLWIGEQLLQRRSLIRHIISNLPYPWM